MKKIKLSEAALYSKKKAKYSELSLDTYITTDNLLQNKSGVKIASILPPRAGSFSGYNIGDILISNIRPYLKKIWFSDREGICSSDVLVLSSYKDFNPKFVYYSIFRDEFFDHVMKGAKGTKMPRGDKDQILEFQIPYFSSIIQERIVNLLSTIDNKIDLNNRINDNLEQMAKTLYDYWFVQFDFPDKKGKPYKSSGGKMIYNAVLKKELPHGWYNGTLDYLGDIVGGSTPSKKIDEFFGKEGIPWITPKDLSLNTSYKFITRGEFDITQKGVKAASLKLLPRGTILLSSRAPIGYLAIACNNVTTNQGFKSFIPNKGFSTPYVFYTIKSALPKIISNASGSTFKEVSGSVLKTIKIYLPKKTIVDNYTKKVAPIFEWQSLLEEENLQLRKLRDWLLPILMNGQVRIN